jgi:hypothetical protein
MYSDLKVVVRLPHVRQSGRTIYLVLHSLHFQSNRLLASQNPRIALASIALRSQNERNHGSMPYD